MVEGLPNHRSALSEVGGRAIVNQLAVIQRNGSIRETHQLFDGMRRQQNRGVRAT